MIRIDTEYLKNWNYYSSMTIKWYSKSMLWIKVNSLALNCNNLVN